jgi:hypothetical protein
VGTASDRWATIREIHLKLSGQALMDNLFPVICLTLIFSGLYILLSLQYSSARSLLEHWAENNGYQILDRSLNYTRFPKTHFSSKQSKYDLVYYVALLDREHHRKNAWVRCPGGIFPREVEVIWDDWTT